MERWFLYGGIALCLFALWAIARRDWVRWGAVMREVDAAVTGHRTSRDGDGNHYAAIYAFQAEGARHEAIDEVYSARPVPPIGQRRRLTYPARRPDLARVPRPALWLAVYGLLLGLIGVFAAKLLGWID